MPCLSLTVCSLVTLCRKLQTYIALHNSVSKTLHNFLCSFHSSFQKPAVPHRTVSSYTRLQANAKNNPMAQWGSLHHHYVSSSSAKYRHLKQKTVTYTTHMDFSPFKQDKFITCLHHLFLSFQKLKKGLLMKLIESKGKSCSKARVP